MNAEETPAGETPAGERRALFLERGSYRRRRLMDAARILPVAGAILLILPLLWHSGGAESGPGPATDAIYVFAVWVLLIAGAAILSRYLTVPRAEPPRAREP
ncbi:hypothetical protein [Tropicimonas sp. IMCC34011]|uniref:hypothetical protein n=1 Tax=Tropicimonas sp. IMCC34011 TaxID=2248759 RepID=UPI000E262AB8|nr:hypothetical protein [Tropicimonas sp. IMCC34011]